MQKTDADETAYSYGSKGYRWYVLVVLTLVYTLHSLDRSLPNILIEPIGREFQLSDGQLGAFSGLLFAIAFSVTVLPMGFISDRVNRRNFLAVILVIWSLATAVGGIAKNFTHLMLARLGVGASESGAAPVLMPMISDIFPPSQRGRAIGFFYTSQAAGLFLASVVGGWVAATYGWRAAFFIAGVPGIILAILLLTTVREPRRGGVEGSAEKQPAPPLRDIFIFLYRNPGVVCIILSAAVIGMVNITISAWLASFFIRVHDLTLTQVGLVVGIAGGLGALIGPPVQGYLSDRLSLRDKRLPLVVVMAAALISMFTGWGMLFTPSLIVAIILLLVSDIGRMGWAPPLYAAVLNHTPVKLRGASMSVVQLTINFLGYGAGPLLTGILSDLFGGGTAIRYAMAIALGMSVLVVILLVVAARLLYDRNGEPRPIAAHAA